MLKGTALAPSKVMKEIAVDPFRDFQRRLNRLFGENVGFWPENQEAMSLSTWAPACDVFENDNSITIKAELPGVNREDVKVTIENNVLTLRGERKFEEEVKRENYHRVERAYGEFMRSFTLPNYVDSTKIKAEFKEGMLNLTLPKREEAKAKQIDVAIK